MASVVLAYTGGTISSAAIYWLQNRKGLKVYTFTGNFGGYPDQEAVCERALQAGAAGAHIGDLRKVFLLYFAFPALRARARIGSGYFLSRALSRPLLVEEIGKLAHENGCDSIAHCAQPHSNDALRFARLAQELCPNLEILTPWTDRSFHSRQAAADYAARHRIEPLADQVGSEYPVDRNIWGTCIEYGSGEDERSTADRRTDTWREPSQELYTITRSPEQAPDEPTALDIQFRHGNPVGLDGTPMEACALLEALNRSGAQAGVGRADTVKDNLNGHKSRFLYEAPGATILYRAHEALENVTVPEDVLDFKQLVSARYTRLIHEGNWYTPLRRALDAYVDQAQDKVTGTVRVKLYRGTCRAVGVQSDHALYRPLPPEPDRCEVPQPRRRAFS